MPPELDQNAEKELPVNPSEDTSNDVREAIAQLKGDQPPVVSDKPQTDAPAEPTKPSRTRDPVSGQFMKADGTVDPDQSPEKVPDADPTKANDVQPSKVAEAPAGWSAEAKAEFSKAPPAVQAAVLKREAEMNEGGARWSEERRAYVEPVREISARHNVHPSETIKRLAAANDYLERDAPAAIAWLANAYKVDLSKLAANPAQPSTPQPQADPALSRIESELLSVKQRLEAEDQRQVNGSIESFSSAKDATGQPLRPHFEAVKVDMGNRLLLAIQQQREMTLEQAYDEACWSNPTIRAQLIAAQTAPAAAAARQREQADKARRGGAVSAHGAPNGAINPPARTNPNSTVEDDVREAMAQLRH